MSPDFIIIGAMKCGTSTVNAYFEDHPDIFMVRGQEPNFFSHDDRFAQGTDWYEALFAEGADARLRGEGSNDYVNAARFPEAAARMAAYKPDLKLIYILRHPVERIISAWIQMRADSRDMVPATLDGAVIQQPEIFVDQSLYWSNLSRYRAHFPDAQIHIGFMEDLKADPDGFFAEICDFLGVGPAPRIERPHQNRSAGKSLPTPLYTKLRQNPVIAGVNKLLPADLKRAVRERFFSKPLSERPGFSSAVAAELNGRLREDAAQILAHTGRPEDFWRF